MRAVNHAASLKTKKHKPVSHPLNDDELALLEDQLDLLANQVDQNDIDAQQPLTLDRFDGLCCGLALSPSIMPIADWIALVMGDATFADKETTQRVRQLLIRHYNHVVYQCRKTDLSQYMPCVFVDDHDQTDISGWCSGFYLAVEMQEDKWNARDNDEIWTDVYIIQALKDADNAGYMVVSDDLDEGEQTLWQTKEDLLALLREEIAEILDEPVDRLSMLLFALSRLQDSVLHGTRQHAKH